MLHYISLHQESIMGGPKSWIVTDFLKKHEEQNLLPDIAGLCHELKNDNLDLKRVKEYLIDYKWLSVSRVEREVATEDGTELREVESGTGVVSWSITEFLQAGGGEITGLFFNTEGVFQWAQKYRFDRTGLAIER